MGMIVTLYLISANVYSSVEAPKARGFSYIEIWMIGTQFPILLALFEYGLILYWKKIPAKSVEDQTEVGAKEKLDKNFRKICRLQSAKNLGNVITIHRNHVRLSLPPDFKNLFLERNRFNSNQVNR